MTASGFAYRGKIGEEHLWKGWHCEVLITSRDQLSGAEQAIEIEGNGDDVIHALEKAVNMLKGYGQHLKEGFGEGKNINPPHPKVSG